MDYPNINAAVVDLGNVKINLAIFIGLLVYTLNKPSNCLP